MKKRSLFLIKGIWTGLRLEYLTHTTLVMFDTFSWMFQVLVEGAGPVLARGLSQVFVL